MADVEQIRTTISEYLARFSAGDREGWLALWADECTMEDPVGSPVRHGRESIGQFYDEGRSQADSVELRPDGDAIVLGHEAAFRFDVRPVLGGTTFSVSAVDVMTFDDDARITSQRAFVDVSKLVLAED